MFSLFPPTCPFCLSDGKRERRQGGTEVGNDKVSHPFSPKFQGNHDVQGPDKTSLVGLVTEDVQDQMKEIKINLNIIVSPDR